MVMKASPFAESASACSVGDAARAAVSDRVGAVLRRMRDVRGDAGDAEAVHRLRTSALRGVAALDAFGGWLPKRGSRGLRRALGRLRRCAGTARDLDVQSSLWRSVGASDDRASAGAGVMEAVCAGRRGRAGVRVWRAVRGERRRAVRVLGESVCAGVCRPAGCVCGDNVGVYGERALALAACEMHGVVASWAQSGASMHEVRMAAKRMRYVFEVFEGWLDWPGVEDLGSGLREIHDALGLDHDLVVACASVDAAVESGVLSEGCGAGLRAVLEDRLMAAERASEVCVESFALRWLRGALDSGLSSARGVS